MLKQLFSPSVHRCLGSRASTNACVLMRGFASQAQAANCETTQFPGAKTPFTQQMEWKENHELFPCFRVMDQHGKIINKDYALQVNDAQLVDMYKHMVKLNQMDNVFYNAQRQGRISFYMTCFGEEAMHIGSAAALSPNDMVYAQYREAGVLMYRGWDIVEFAHQLFSNQKDLGKGRQMPVHYGSRDLNYHTISSPLGTQLPQAVGAAYGFKREKSDRIAVVYFGDGAASEGDFHSAVNFSATLKAPMLFFCRNNGYAISTHVKEQYGGDGIAGRGPAFGIKTIRIDGNDLLAVFDATKEGRRLAFEEQRPVFIEAMSYRAGHHSTSDDSTRYRDKDELLFWMEDQNPINRTRMLLEKRGLWDADQEVAHITKCKDVVMAALANAEGTLKPAISQVFADVYDTLQPHLIEQEQEMLAHLAQYPDAYPLNDYASSDTYENPADKVIR